MNNLHFSKYLMWGSFVLFLVAYFFANHQYSNIFEINYILFTIIQVFMILNNRVKRPLQIILTVISTVFIFLCSLNTQIQHDLSLFLICAGILFIGNLSTSLAYNPFIGIRIFSTRNDPKNWQATHQLLALLSIPISCGILLFCTIFNGNIVVPSAHYLGNLSYYLFCMDLSEEIVVKMLLKINKQHCNKLSINCRQLVDACFFCMLISFLLNQTIWYPLDIF